MLRAGFGATPQTVKELANLPVETVAEILFRDAATFKPLRVVKGDIPEKKDRQKSSAKRQKNLKKKLIGGLKMLNLSWFYRLADEQGILPEKMAYFWHDHFACRTHLPWLAEKQLNTLRQHALGNFGILLKAIAHDPAMIGFLNNQQNKKQQPNENFARELMELFTLGEGNVYTEDDIKEAARAFTGWGYNAKGEYVFRSNTHDFGTKTFLGQQGNFDGDEIIDIILQQKQTARYITGKIYAEFVHPIPDEVRIEALATTFYDSGYDIEALMRSIFMSDWFYENENIGAKIKSPIELLVGLKKMLGIYIKEEDTWWKLQHGLGQALGYPPSVAGWPGGRAWIDSSTLVLRLKIPLMIFAATEYEYVMKAQLDDMYSPEMKHLGRKLKNIKAIADWERFGQAFSTSGIHAEEEMIEYLLQVPIKTSTLQEIKNFVDHSSDENKMKTLAVRLMSLPEFQLC